MIVRMLDSVSPGAIPLDAQAVAGYIDGSMSRWPAQAWSHWPASTPRVRISVMADPLADVMDVERGNASVSQVASAITHRAGAGLPTVVYCSLGRFGLLRKQLPAAAGWWVANWTGIPPATLPAGACAVQFADPPKSGGQWDASVVDTALWPGWPSTPDVVGRLTLANRTYGLIEEISTTP